jgi:uncharacterized protein (TIRG00374 family)
MATSRRLRAALGWLVSLAVIAFIVQAVEWTEVGAALGRVRLAYLIPLTILTALHFLVRSYRWRYLLPHGRSTPFRTLNDTLMLGLMATFVLPLRAGEILRPLLLSRMSTHTFPVAFASVVIERFFDLSAVLLLFGVLIVFVPGVPDIAFTAAAALSALGLALLGFVLVGGLRPRWVLGPCRALMRPLPARIGEKIIEFVEHLLDGARVLRSVRNLVPIILLTGAVWLINHLFFLCGLWMFGVPEAAWPALAVVVMVALAVAFPSAPGFLGVFQAGCIVALALFGIDEELAVAYSLVVHAHQFVFICGFGAAVLALRGLSFDALRAAPSHEPR